MVSLNIKESTPKIRIHQATGKILDETIYMQFIFMDQCVWLMIGSAPCPLENISIAMKTKFDKHPIINEALGIQLSDNIKSLSNILINRLKNITVAYISYHINIPEVDLAINKLVLEQIQVINTQQ